jgi:ribosomal protein S12 methylthiotransferase
MKVKVYLHPVACPKAEVDLEKVGWIFEQAGFELVNEPGGAAFAIVFGCGFIDDAKKESIEDILGLVEMKQRSKLDHVLVVGCLPQKYGRSLALSLPEVDAFVGNPDLYTLPMICAQVLEGTLPAKVWTGDLAVLGELGGVPHRVRPGSRPWTRAVMISDGCDNACTYCAIPEMRGPLRSRDIASIIEETGQLVDQGAREIVLTGQDTASYGNDLGANGLASLLDTLALEFPDTWLRLAYANPDNLEDEVAHVIAARANVCDYIDIPIQHASARILKAMGRAGPEVKRRKIRNLREAVPDIVLRTSLIVGFPGETEDDMAALLDFLAEADFDLVGVFAFSSQPGTPAARLRAKVPEHIKEARVMDVVSLQKEISLRKMRKLVGRAVEVLVDERDGPDCLGHSRYDMAELDRTVRITGCGAGPGDLVTARLESVSAPFEWTARLV